MVLSKEESFAMQKNFNSFHALCEYICAFGLQTDKFRHYLHFTIKLGHASVVLSLSLFIIHRAVHERLVMGRERVMHMDNKLQLMVFGIFHLKILFECLFLARFVLFVIQFNTKRHTSDLPVR